MAQKKSFKGTYAESKDEADDMFKSVPKKRIKIEQDTPTSEVRTESVPDTVRIISSEIPAQHEWEEKKTARLELKLTPTMFEKIKQIVVERSIAAKRKVSMNEVITQTLDEYLLR
jgi:hypothetical protein